VHVQKLNIRLMLVGLPAWRKTKRNVPLKSLSSLSAQRKQHVDMLVNCLQVRQSRVDVKPQTHDKQMLANNCWTTVWLRRRTQQTTTTLLQQ